MPALDEKTTILIEQLKELLEPVIEAEGMDLVELEYRREGHGWVLRLFIDQENGVSVNDCAHMSHVVGDLLDVADLIGNPYHLEVSSPGLDRPLRKPEHFRDQMGKVVEVRTTVPIQNRRRFKGVLTSADSERIIMDCDGQGYEIPLAMVERARLRYFESLGD